MTLRLKKPPVIASICALAGCTILCGLGTWQAQKYILKTSLKNSMECTAPAALPPPISAGFDILEPDGCRSIQRFTGQFNEAAPLISIGPRTHEGEIGYHLYAPLISGADSSQILVNLGWSKDKSSNIGLSREIQINGHLLAPSAPNHFTPANIPEKQEWYALKVNDIAAHYDLEKLSPYVIFAEEVTPSPRIPLVPAALSKTYLTPEVHLQYAAFWYFMGVVLLGVFIFRFALTKA